MTTTYRAAYNTEARQWDVIDGAGNIVAMCGGGKRGKASAERKALNLMATEYPPGTIPPQEPLSAEDTAKIERFLRGEH